MKKIVKFALRTIVVLLVPAIFTGVSIFAVSQSFLIGLIVLLSSSAIQIILAKKFSEQFAWAEYDYLDFSSERYLLFDRMSARLNLLMNFVKVGTIGSIFYLLLQHFPANSFGRMGWIVTLSLSAIILVIFMIKRTDGSYIKLRLVMSVVVAIGIVAGSYLYFGTQAIWLILLLSIVFGLMNGFKELGDIISDDIPAMFAVLLSAALTLISIVSTIYQFGYAISDFSYYLFVGNNIDFTIVLQAIGLIAVIAAILLSVKYYRRWKVRKLRELNRKQEAEAAAKAKAQREEQELAITNNLLNIIATLESGDVLSNDKLVYLAQNLRSLNGQKLAIEPLTKVDWSGFFTISNVKKQIVWDHKVVEVIALFNSLYNKSYNDKELRAITRSINALCRFIEGYKAFAGYEAFNDVLARAKDIKREL